MGLRPGHCYDSTKDRPYTRHAIRVPRKDYIGAVPGVKTRQFNMGNGAKDYTHILDLVTGGESQIRDNAIESSRIIINRYLVNKLGKEGFFMKIRIYPHHILRENKQAQGAHADRIQKGMSHPFGKPIGRAARVKPGQVLISVLVDAPGIETAKKALLRAKARMNCKLKVIVGTDVESIGTKPKKIKEIVEEAPKAAEEAKEEKGAKKEEGKAEAKKEEGKKEAGPKEEKAPKKEEKKAEKKK